MINKPEKPKNYWRDYSIIWGIALMLFALTISFDFNSYALFFLILFIVWIPGFWFRKYNSELEKYNAEVAREKKMKAEQQRLFAMQGSKVNQNIERYVSQQKQRRANARWWQFWV